MAERRKHQLGAKVDPTKCELWLGAKNLAGYGMKRRDGKVRMVHRLVWEEHNGKIPDKMIVCHKCDNPTCINPDHLFLGTQSDNIIDSVLKNRAYRAIGMSHGMARLTDDMVRAIRARREEGAYMRTIALEFGCGKTTIWKILNKVTWTHLE